MAAVRSSGCALRFASEELRADHEIVLAAVKSYGYALEYASEDLRADREIVLAARRSWGRALEYASEDLRADREIVLAAVKSSGCALEDASEELRADREIVLVAVRSSGYALRFASEELRADREIVLVALRTDAAALQYASEVLKNDPRVVAEALVADFNLSDEHDYMDGSLKLLLGSELELRLHRVLQSLGTEQGVGFVDEESVLEYCRQWEQSIWHKIWLVRQLEIGVEDAYGRVIIEQADFPLELHRVSELRHVAPVIGAVVSHGTAHGINWRSMQSYEIFVERDY